MKSFVIFSIFFISCTIYGQNAPTILFDDFTSNRANPSQISKNKLDIKIGEVAFNLSTGGIKLNSVLNNDGKISFNKNGYQLPVDKPITFQLKYHTFDVNYKLKSFDIQFGHAWKANSSFKYSQGFSDLISLGNAAFLGEEIPVEIKQYYDSYNELYLGLSKKFDKWSFGIRLKLLNGIDNIWTESGAIGLLTSIEDYSITTNNHISIYSNGALNVKDISQVSFDIRNLGFQNILQHNFGFAADFGFGYQINEQTNAYVGLHDIGFIKWEEGTHYSNNQSKQLQGIDIIDQLINGTSFSIIDSLYGLVDLQSTSLNYSRKLNGYANFGIKHILSDKFVIGIDGVINHTFGELRFSSLRLQAMRCFEKLKIGSALSYQNGTLFNIGLFGNYKYKRFTIYGLTDNVLALIVPKKSNNIGGRVGLMYEM